MEKLADDVHTKLDAVDRATLNILRLKLQQAMASADIDAWSDLIADASLLDMASSKDISHYNNRLSRGLYTGAPTSHMTFGITERYFVGQTFTVANNCNLSSVTAIISESYGAYITAKIYATSGGLPTNVLYTADHTVKVLGNEIERTFTFTNAALTAGTVYAVVFSTDTRGSSKHQPDKTAPNIVDGNYCCIRQFFRNMERLCRRHRFMYIYGFHRSLGERGNMASSHAHGAAYICRSLRRPRRRHGHNHMVSFRRRHELDGDNRA